MDWLKWLWVVVIFGVLTAGPTALVLALWEDVSGKTARTRDRRCLPKPPPGKFKRWVQRLLHRFTGDRR